MSKAYQEAVLRGKEKTFSQFIWDGQKQELFGRGFCSWLKIYIFYNIYYGFLAVFFAICMMVFYQTLDEKMPKYSPGNQDSILRNAGLGFRPMPDIWEIDQTEIWYNTNEPYSFYRYTEKLDEFIRPYEDNKGCPHSNCMDCYEDSSPSNEYGDEVCMFRPELLGKCTKENGWGYETRSPCVILKMNKMIGWHPEVFYDPWEIPENIPDDLRNYINQNATDNQGRIIKQMVWLSCTQTMADGEILDDMGEIKYYPQPGFPAYFFPYTNQPGYMPPLVAIQFTAPPLNRRINVECRLWARNINHYRKESLGMVQFGLVIKTVSTLSDEL